MRAEQRLFHAWREHRLINAIDQVVFELDEHGRWIFLNAAWHKLSGYTVAESVGDDFGNYLFVEDGEGEAVRNLLQSVDEMAPVQTVLRLKRKEGNARWVTVELRRSAVNGAGSRRTFVGSISDAGEQMAGDRRYEKQVGELLAQRERQVAFAASVAREFASGKELKALYDWFVNALNDNFHYFHTQLYHYDGSRQAMTLAAASGEAAQSWLGQEIALGQDAALGQAALGKVVLQEVGKQGARAPMRMPDGDDELLTPILLGDETLGAIVVYSKESRLDDEDRLLLQGVAAQLATAIEGLRLRQETEERMAELENLQRLMRREAWLRAREHTSGGALGYRFDRKLMQTVDAGEDSAFPGVVDAGEEEGAAPKSLARPLEIRGQSFGVIGVEDDPDNPLTAADVQLLEAISQQVSEAMENARLLEQTQKRAVELETVARVSTATSTILDKDKLLQGVVELTKRSFNLYHAHIYLLDEEKRVLALAAGSGDAGSQMVQEGWRISLDEPRSIVARSARERRGIIVHDVRKETGFLPNRLLPATRSELAVPMISGNRLLGVLDVQANVVNYFTQDDVRIQSALAGQVATALQNATLYQEQLETAEKLREFDRLKSEFLASMSHELRTPLNSIIGFADVLLEGIDGELNERMREDVQLIRNSGQHLRELIGDILDMSKIEAGMMELRYETIDLAAMRQEIEGFARTQLMAYDKDLQFKMLLSPEVSIVEADQTRFKQVLFNLLSNAIKFTAQGSVSLEMQAQDEKLLVRVSDTGIGIKEENIPIVFEQFRQVDGSLTRTAGGTGLGLPISKSLVELHGGDIWVDSVVEEGTTFCFTIPLEKPAARYAPEQKVLARTDGDG